MFSRDILTPAVMSLFFVVALTGAALFFHFMPGVVKETHEWLGLPFAAFGIWHAVKNWRGVASYVKRRASVVAMVAVVAFALVFTAVSAKPEQGNPRMVIKTFAEMPVRNIGMAFGLTSEQALANLKAKGIEADEDQTVKDVVRQSHASPVQVLMAISGRGEEPSRD